MSIPRHTHSGAASPATLLEGRGQAARKKPTALQIERGHTLIDPSAPVRGHCPSYTAGVEESGSGKKRTAFQTINGNLSQSK